MFKLSALKREIKGEKAREQGLLPAVLYGAGGETDSLTLVKTEFIKLHEEAGGSSLIDLSVENKDAGKVLIHDIQFDPLKGWPIHVDLIRIDMSKPITANVELVYIGEAPAVKELGGTLVKNVEEVEVECLPKDLVNHIDVSLTSLTNFEAVIKVSDLVLPAGMVVISPAADIIIAKAQAAMTEEQFKALEDEANASIDVSKIESAAPKKKEEAEDIKEEKK
jgi:large subunit ribosomal protein L25